MNEIWKDVKDLEGYVKVSNLGNLKRIKIQQNYFGRGTNEIKVDRPLKATMDRGYYKIAININGKRHLKYVHRMVAEAFIPNPKNYKEVNHIDNNPSNNCVNNLEWCDRKYNMRHVAKHQSEIKDRHERRIEALEMIWFLATQNDFVSSEKIFNLISEDLLGDY